MAIKILLVDDEVEFTELAGTMLDFHNLNVTSINDPQTVIAALATHSYNVLVTDLMMPNLDGFELIRLVRDDPRFDKLPILVLTAKPLTEAERKRLLEDHVHFMLKPFDPLALVERLKSLAQEYRSGDSSL